MPIKATSKNIIRRRVGAKPDPIIGLVDRADTLLADYTQAYNKFHQLKDRLKGPRYASVSPPDTFLPGYWGLTFRFNSVKHIEREFRKVGQAFRNGWAGSNNGRRAPKLR